MVFKKGILIAFMASVIFSSVVYGGQSDENLNKSVVTSTEDVQQQKTWSDYFVVAHACGAVDGRTETNCKEAFIQNYEKGQRVFEIDFSLTLDNKLVARHDFEQNSYYVMEQSYNKKVPVMMHDKFMSTPINFKYTPMDAHMVVSLLNEYKDAYIITDSKNTDKASIEKEFTLLKEAVEKSGNTEIFDRIVVQIYYPEMQGYVRSLGGFKNFMLTTYQIKNPDYGNLAEYCSKNDIEAMVMPKEVVTKEIVNTIHSKGVKVYTHTLNRLYDIKQYIDVYGIDGVYSDIIVEGDIKYITE